MPRARTHLSLTGQVALLSLIPILALGLVLARGAAVAHRDPHARRRRRVRAAGRAPRHPAPAHAAELRDGLSTGDIRSLDEQLRERSVRRDLARIKIWNNRGRIVYSDDHALIGRSPQPSDDLRDALAGRASPGRGRDAEPATTRPPARSASGDSSRSTCRCASSSPGRPAGVFEIYLSYRPIAAAITQRQAHDRTARVPRPRAAVGRPLPDRRLAPRAGCAARPRRTIASRATTS